MFGHSNVGDNNETVDINDYSKYYYNFEENEYLHSNQFIPRIEGTELLVGIAFMNSNYVPILTSRVADDKRKFYLFDILKIWTNKATKGISL